MKASDTPTYAELEGLYGSEYLELYARIQACDACGGDGYFDEPAAWPGTARGYTCAACNGTGEQEVELEPITLEDLEKPECRHCGGSKIEEIYGGHGAVLEVPCSYCEAASLAREREGA